ncbi:NAD-dependent epimerase/dehydratase family protein [SAR86 cluster bacterium]|nr:NAD-dependent epimerase/dehydratase family protein [SAR86 cluster bacterium]
MKQKIKTIVVTGGEGFIGSNLINKLNSKLKNLKIISIDNGLSKQSNRIKANKNNKIIYIKGHTKQIKSLLKKEKSIDTIFHFGEFSRIVKSFEHSEKCFSSNHTGTLEVIKFCSNNKIRIIYSASSSKFGNKGRDENLSPYSWTKSKNIELIKNYAKWFNLDYEIVYFYNVYGPGQIRNGHMAAVIGIFENCYLKGKPLTVIKPGTQKRDFTHVDDIINGVMLAWKKKLNGEFMLGTNKNSSVIDIAKLFNHPIEYIGEKPGERLASTIPDINSQKRLGYKAQIKIEDYIKTFVKQNAKPK